MTAVSAETNERLYVGIDVQIRRPCALVALDGKLRMRASCWVEGTTAASASREIQQRLAALGPNDIVTIGIDAPRCPLERKRPFYWDGKRREWRARRPSERGWGRHCEVVVAASGLAKPQWTPPHDNSPEWMALGYGLFRELAAYGYVVHEVFPSASYRLLRGERHPPIAIDFSAFMGGVKDVADACVAAYTVHEFEAGRGCAVGSDGQGEIVLPRPLPEGVAAALFHWPSTG